MLTSEELRHVVIHGHRRAYRKAGSGPVLVLWHGLGCDSSTWANVIPRFAENYTVIAPDLFGTRSFGQTERVCLVSSGGLGREVFPFIRLLTLSGSGAVLAAATKAPLRPALAAGLRSLSRLPMHATRNLDEVSRIYESLADPAVRSMARRLASQVVDWRGQYVIMTDRADLTLFMPFLVIWGSEDMVVPASHAAAALECAAGARVHVLDNSGHFPHKDHPAKFVKLITQFIETSGRRIVIAAGGGRSGVEEIRPNWQLSTDRVTASRCPHRWDDGLCAVVVGPGFR